MPKIICAGSGELNTEFVIERNPYNCVTKDRENPCTAGTFLLNTVKFWKELLRFFQNYDLIFVNNFAKKMLEFIDF